MKMIKKYRRRVGILRSILSHKPNEAFLEISDSFPEDCRLYKNGKFNTDIGKDNYEHVVDFLDGFWFERYIGEVIKNGLKNKYDEVLMNQKPYKTAEKRNCFELDMVLMKGYQLIGISCTISKKKSICKEKGFEIILRKRQIGGEEAKAILITRVDDADKLQSELLLSTGTSKENIKVLGIHDWKKDDLIKKVGGYL